MTEVSNRRIAIWDMDGTLADDMWRRNLLPPNEKATQADYDAYHELCDRDHPISHAVERFNEHIRAGDMIAIATARPMVESIGKKTTEWLAKYTEAKDPNSFILMMRGVGDTRSAVDVKREMLGYLQRYATKMGLSLGQAYDDREDIAAMWQQAGIPAAIVTPNSIQGAAPVVVGGQQPNPVFNPQDMIDAAQEGENGQQSPPADSNKRFWRGQVSTAHVGERIVGALNTFNERGAIYGQNDIIAGRVLAELFPGGVTLSKPEDFRIFMMLNHIVGKLTRFTASGLRDADSAHDLVTYAAFAELLASEHAIVAHPGGGE